MIAKNRWRRSTSNIFTYSLQIKVVFGCVTQDGATMKRVELKKKSFEDINHNLKKGGVARREGDGGKIQWNEMKKKNRGCANWITYALASIRKVDYDHKAIFLTLRWTTVASSQSFTFQRRNRRYHIRQLIEQQQRLITVSDIMSCGANELHKLTNLTIITVSSCIIDQPTRRSSNKKLNKTEAGKQMNERTVDKNCQGQLPKWFDFMWFDRPF